jgi:hypothetical protein
MRAWDQWLICRSKDDGEELFGKGLGGISGLARVTRHSERAVAAFSLFGVWTDRRRLTRKPSKPHPHGGRKVASAVERHARTASGSCSRLRRRSKAAANQDQRRTDDFDAHLDVERDPDPAAVVRGQMDQDRQK